MGEGMGAGWGSLGPQNRTSLSAPPWHSHHGQCPPGSRAEGGTRGRPPTWSDIIAPAAATEEGGGVSSASRQRLKPWCSCLTLCLLQENQRDLSGGQMWKEKGIKIGHFLFIFLLKMI